MLRKIISSLLAAFVLISCNNSGNYTITGAIEGILDGDTVTLGYSTDGEEFTITDYSTVSGGEFRFSGKSEGCDIYYICYNNGEEPQYMLFFLEEGDIRINISQEQAAAEGTATNDLNTTIEKRYSEYISKIYEHQYRLSTDSLLTDSLSSELTLQIMETQRDAGYYLQDIIRENYKSTLGLFYLVQYSFLFDDDELTFLTNNIPEECINRNNNCMYDILQEELFNRNMNAGE